jgi:hypothetical protein
MAAINYAMLAATAPSRCPVGCKYSEFVVEKVQLESVVETTTDLKRKCSSTIK